MELIVGNTEKKDSVDNFKDIPEGGIFEINPSRTANFSKSSEIWIKTSGKSLEGVPFDMVYLGIKKDGIFGTGFCLCEYSKSVYDRARSYRIKYRSNQYLLKITQEISLDSLRIVNRESLKLLDTVMVSRINSNITCSNIYLVIGPRVFLCLGWTTMSSFDNKILFSLNSTNMSILKLTDYNDIDIFHSVNMLNLHENRSI